jgi:hypothetical protein
MLLSRLFLVISFVCLSAALSYAVEDEEPAKTKEDSTLSFAFEDDFSSQYVWRGFAVSKGPVMQPEASLSVYDATFSVWSNFVLSDEANQGQFNEVDLSADYHFQFGDFEVQPSFEYYLFPNQSLPSSGEFSVWLAYSLGPIQIFMDHYFDVVRAFGSYYGDLGVSYEKEFFEKFAWRVSGSIGWASRRFNRSNAGVSLAAWENFIGDLEMTYRPLEHFYVRPHVQVSALLDPALRSAIDDATILSGGVALGVTF